MREFFANLIAIALAVAFLAHFGMIAVWGAVVIHEPNTAILYSEIALFIGVIGFACYNIARIKRID